MSSGRAVFVLFVVRLLLKREAAVGMWKSRVVCEISKRRWTVCCAVHGRVISIAVCTLRAMSSRALLGLRRHAGFEARAIRLAVDDKIVGIAGKAIDGALRANRIGEGGEPFVRTAVRGHDDGACPIALEENLVQVAALGGVEGVDGEIVQNQEVDRNELAELGFVAVIQPRVLQRFQHLIGPDGEDRGAAPARDVTERMGEKRLADADRADNRDVGVAVEKAEGRQLVEERPIEGHLRRGVPGFQVHGGIEMRFLHAERHGETVPPGDFVAEDEEEPVLMRQLLLAREHEPLRQGVEDPPQAQAAQDGLQIGADGLGRHWDSPPSEDASAARSGRAYWWAGRRYRASGRTRAPADADAGAAVTASSSIRCNRLTSSMSAASAVVHASVTRAAP